MLFPCFSFVWWGRLLSWYRSCSGEQGFFSVKGAGSEKSTLKEGGCLIYFLKNKLDTEA